MRFTVAPSGGTTPAIPGVPTTNRPKKKGEKVLKSFLRGFCYDHQPRNGGKFECVSVGGGEITIDVPVTVSGR